MNFIPISHIKTFLTKIIFYFENYIDTKIIK